MMIRVIVFYCFTGYVAFAQDITNGRIINVYNESVDVAWDPFPGATEYDVKLFKQFTFPPIPLIIKKTQENKISLEFTEKLIQPFIQVFVAKIDNKTVTQQFKTNLIRFGLTNLSRPIVENVRFGQVLSTVMSIQWDEVENATTYLISYSNGTEMRTQTKNTSIILMNLTPNTTYSIRVEVTAQNNNTLDFPIKSNVVKMTTMANRDVQLRISNVEVTENSFKLTWNKLKFAKMYHVYYALLTEMKITSTFKFIATGTDNAFINNLSSNKTYQVFVKVMQMQTDEEPLETIKSKTISIKTATASAIVMGVVKSNILLTTMIALYIAKF